MVGGVERGGETGGWKRAHGSFLCRAMCLGDQLPQNPAPWRAGPRDPAQLGQVR